MRPFFRSPIKTAARGAAPAAQGFSIRVLSGPLTVFVLVLMGLDFALYPVAISVGPGPLVYVIAFGFGAVFAQAGLAAVWYVFSARRVVVRLAWCGLFGLLCYGSMVTWVVVRDGFERAIFAVLASLPALFFAVQAPLWSTRLWLRWEVSRISRTTRDSIASPLTLRHLVGATSAVAVALALVRFGSSLSDEPQDFMSAMLVQMAVLATLSLALIPAFVYCVLRPTGLDRVLLGITAWSAILVTVQVTIAGAASGRLPSPPMLLASVLGVGGFAAVMSTGLLLARSVGFRLRWPDRGPPADRDLPSLAP